MPSPDRKPTVQPSVSDETVEAKTGKRWRQWFEQLDNAGARSWDHKTIAKRLHQEYGLTFWWAQTVTVAYEQAVGLRARHEMPDGYQIQRQRVAKVASEQAWSQMEDPELRRRWLPELADAALHSAQPEKLRLQLHWDGFDSPKGRVLIAVQVRDDNKCAIGVMHSKLNAAESAEAAKAFWTERLEGLVAQLESGELR